MEMYEVKDDTGKVRRITGRDAEHACRRVADLYQVAVVAVRESRDARDAIRIGMPEGSDG